MGEVTIMFHKFYRAIVILGMLVTLGSCGGGGGGTTAISDVIAPNTSSSHPTSYFNDVLSVVLTCSDSGGSGCANIYYTLDGTTPTTSSNTYNSRILITDDTVLQFFSVDVAGNQESINQTVYTLSKFSRSVADNVSPVTYYGPFNNDNTYTKYQFLYKASQIGGSGIIDKLSFIRAQENTTEITCDNTSLRLGHTSLNSLTTTFADNIEQGKGSLITVRNNSTINFPTGNASQHVELSLDTPFYYNGVDNLVLEIERSSACSGRLYVRSEDLGPGTNPQLFSHTVSTTGSNTSHLHHINFRFRGGDNQITSNHNNINGIPFRSSGDKVQLLFYADEINGKGRITGIGFPVGVNVNPATSYDYTVNVRLGHTDLSNLTTDFNSNYSDTPITLTSNMSYSTPGELPDNAYIWVPIPDGIFNYNGDQNLIIEMDVPSGSGTTFLKVRTGGVTQRRAYGPAGGSTATGTDTHAYGLKLRIGGGSIDIITDGVGAEGLPYNTVSNKRQYLLRSAELGTGGNITKIAHRFNSNHNSQSTYNNCRIVLGHTENTTLGNTSFSGNMIDDTIVLDSNITIQPALAGDWIEQELSTPFNYDSTKNLVVQMSCDGGTSTVAIEGTYTDAATRYPQRRAYNTTTANDDTPVGVGDYMIDFRYWVN